MELRLTDRCGTQPARTVHSLIWSESTRCTARDLIGERVAVEFRALNAASPCGDLGLHLVQYPRHAGCTLQEAVALALRAFELEAFFVIVNGQQITDVDQPFALAPGSEVTFLRLLPKLAA